VTTNSKMALNQRCCHLSFGDGRRQQKINLSKAIALMLIRSAIRTFFKINVKIESIATRD